jgi:hypothetical protein
MEIGEMFKVDFDEIDREAEKIESIVERAMEKVMNRCKASVLANEDMEEVASQMEKQLYDLKLHVINGMIDKGHDFCQKIYDKCMEVKEFANAAKTFAKYGIGIGFNDSFNLGDVYVPKRKTFRLESRRYYNHGCTDAATYEEMEDGIHAVCIDVTSCHSCWQVGHDSDHEYDYVGNVREIADIVKDRDYVDPEEEDA